MSLLKRLRTLLRDTQAEDDLDAELNSHIDMRTDELVASGVPADEARRRAVAAFGNRAYMKEEARSFDTVLWLETLVHDIRYGLRQLVRNPGFTMVAVLTLALGIGANTAIFTAVNAVLLRPLPYANVDRLVALRGSQSLPDILDIARMSSTLEGCGGWSSWYLDLAANGPPEQIDAALIGGDVFPMLGVAPHLGSTFNEADDIAGEAVVVASHDFWQSHLGSDPNAIGRPLRLSGSAYTLIGVMPRGFHLPNSTSQLWIPFRVGYPEAVDARGAHFMSAMARLKDGVTIAQANAELEALGKRIGEANPAEARTFSVMTLPARFTGEVRTPLLVLLGAVTLVLLIACSNFATLLLARGATRVDEMQVRSALGARPLRLVRQLLTESVVLSLMAAAVGIAFAYAGTRALLALTPEDVHKIYDVSAVDPAALAFAIAVSILTGMMFGVIPAWHAARDGEFRSAGMRVAGGRTGARRALVIGEVALALMLLAAAGLLIRSLWQLQNVPMGMNPDSVLTMRLTFPATRYGPIPVQQQFLARLDERLRTIPGIEHAGIVSELPLSGWRMMHNMIVEGQPPVAPGKEPEIYTHEISPGFFQTMGAQMVAGRTFTDQDTANAPLVAVVNEAFVKRFLADRDPIGARARWARSEKPQWMTIVGVVRDMRFDSLEDPQEPTIYTPYTQKQQVWKRFAAIVLRPRPGNDASVMEAAKQAVWSLDPQLPVTHVLPMREVLGQSIQERRLITMLLAAFAALAVTLSLMGVYGVIAYLVTQRRQEVGIRVALGARRLDVLWMMVRQGLPLLGMGLALGTAGTFASTRVLRKLLYGVSTTDIPTFVVVASLLAGVAFIAIVLPAMRATRIDPITALRAE